MFEERNTSQELAPSRTAYQDSKNGSIHSNSAPVAAGGEGGKAEIHDRTGLYISIIALVFAALAFGAAVMLPSVYAARAEVQESRIAALNDRTEKAEREARVMQERWNDLKVELAKRGIPTSDH
jgi:hypothetical protein